jgi:hypothetical protein
LIYTTIDTLEIVLEIAMKIVYWFWMKL